MKWSTSLIYVSLFSYIGAIFMTILGYPPLFGLSVMLQIVYYSLGMFACFLVLKYRKIGYLLASIYGVVAMFSFSGVQIWFNYDGVLALGPYMALWDIVLGVAMLDELELPVIFKSS